MVLQEVVITNPALPLGANRMSFACGPRQFY
jgi:hypothetical protein